MKQYKIINQKIIIYTDGKLCKTSKELIQSELFKEIIQKGIKKQEKIHSPLLFNLSLTSDEDDINKLIALMELLAENPISTLEKIMPQSDLMLKNRNDLSNLIEFLYNFWREFERYIICDTEFDSFDERPYRTFNQTVEELTHLVRKVYRDISENILNKHPKTYRQVNSGAEFSCISSPLKIFPERSAFSKLNTIPIIHQILMNPPLILNTPMNKRKGQFEKHNTNILNAFEPKKDEWLCYPAKVGDLLIHIYFHQHFFEQGFSACNLFELASKEELNRQPDAVYLYGMHDDQLQNPGFTEDPESGILIGFCPNEPEYGYFGYLKKMVLTLHNTIKIKDGKLPFHGSLVKITLQNGKKASILMIGDSGAGKSETLEAYKDLGQELISDITIISDDMGSIQLDEDKIPKGIGTEIGAFLRLDDLKPGFAFGQIDRSIIMNAHKVNARIILPVAPYSKVLEGTKIDYIFYANNYETVDENHPVIEQIPNAQNALKIFSEGKVMSKGTTNTTGIVGTYFANIFGPVQSKEAHQEIAEQFFNQFYESDILVGQIRTQLGISGMEQKGPEIAAKALIEMIS